MLCLWRKFVQSCTHCKTVLHGPASADGWPDTGWQCRRFPNWCCTLEELPSNSSLNLQSFPHDSLLLQPDVNPDSTPQNLWPLAQVPWATCALSSACRAVPRALSATPPGLPAPSVLPWPTFSLWNISLEDQGSPQRSPVWSPYFYHSLMSFLK